jgi:hypothetical protein
MADQNPQIFVANIGAITNANLPIFKCPAGYGGLTILAVQSTQLTAGTTQLYLIDMGAAGTTTNGGTLATSGTAHAAKVPVAWTVSATTPYLAEGSYLAVKEGNIGTTVTVTEVAITYKWGK